MSTWASRLLARRPEACKRRAGPSLSRRQHELPTGAVLTEPQLADMRGLACTQAHIALLDLHRHRS